MSETIVDPHLTEQRKYLGSRPGMAHFAGTGPRGKQCYDCINFVRPAVIIRAKGMRCYKYFQMMKHWHPSPLPSITRACKYFEQRQWKKSL